MKVYRTNSFIKWLKKLRDSQAKFRIYKRIERLTEGNPGDHRFLGDISEMRINYGPGYRIYFWNTGKKIIVLLCGGDKTTQETDIIKARKMVKNYNFNEEEK